MARKDVELVIRAKEDAKKAILSVSDALNTFVAGQADLQKVAGQSETSLGRLGKSLKDLQTSMGGLGAGDKIAQELDRARSATDRLAKATAEATGETIGYTREARAAARQTERFRVESEQVAAAVARQSAAVKEAKAAQSALNSVTRQAAADRARLVEKDKQLSAQIEKQRFDLALAGAAFRDLEADIAKTSNPTKKLQNDLASVGRAVRTAEEGLEDLRSTQRMVRDSIEKTAQSVARANDIYGGTAGALKKQVAALKDLKATQEGVNAQVSESAKNQRALEAAASKAAKSLAAQGASLESAQAEYRELEAVVRETGGALAGLEAKARGPLLKAFGQQAKTVSDLNQEYAQFSSEAQRLGRWIGKVKEPSDQLVAAFTRAQQGAARARQEFREQQTVLAQLRRVLKETGGDVDTFAARQARFEAILDRAAKSYQEYGRAAKQAAAAASKTAQENLKADGATKRLAASYNTLGANARRAANETRTLAGAMRAFYGESRTALSFTQRLRSELLSLVAAYGGFFAAIQGVKATVAAFQSVEAATARLAVVFDQDQSKIANELDFIRRNAERLGVEFGSLAQEYTKFAIATKDTNLEGEKTRKIFISVAEAARVNNNSQDELRGVFTALTQIVSKGSVQLEELKQQLGDRLPGALQIMAEAAGVTTAELIDMIEAGKLSSDVLVSFADVLDKRFGKQLPASLENTTAELGRLKDGLFQSSLRVANGGFLQSFTDLIRTLNEVVRGAEFETFLDRLSAGLAQAADFVAFLARNFGLVTAAITGFIGLKIVPFILVIMSRLGLLTGATVSTSRGFRAMSAAIASGAVTMTRAQVAVRGLTIALRGLMSSTGVGLLVVGIGAAIGAWATSADESTEALNTHRQMVDTVKNAYDEVGESVTALRNEIESISTTSARKNLADLTEAFRKSLDELVNVQADGGGSFYTRFFGIELGASATSEYRSAVAGLVSELRAGDLEAREFASRIDEVNEQFRDGSRGNERYANELDAVARALVTEAEAMEEARDILILKTGSEEEAAEAAKRLSGALEDAGDAVLTAAQKSEQFTAALLVLQDLVPDLADKLEDLDDKAELKGAYEAALRLAQTYGQVAAAVDAYQKGLNAIEGEAAMEVFKGVSGGVETAFALISKFERFEPNPYPDGPYDSKGRPEGEQIYRAGFGSDEITLSDGSVQKVTQGMTVAFADAQRDLIRRIAEFQTIIKLQIGEERFATFGEEQQAALTSIAYNYGDLPDRLVAAIRTGTTTQIAEAIRGLGGDNGGINRGRRNKEAAIFGAGGDPDVSALVDIEEERAKAAAKLAEERAKDAEKTKDAIADGAFEIEQQKLLLADQERQSVILEAIRNAKADNVNISEEELRVIGEQAGALYDLEQQVENKKTAQEEAEAAEKRVNDLLEVRTALQEKLAALQERGAGKAAIDQVRDSMKEVNVQILEAIDNALELFRALKSSDPAVQAVIAQLETLGTVNSTVANQVKIDWDAVANQLASGVIRAMDDYIARVEDGESKTEAARNAFKQYAADFLRLIADMIIQQLILNALKTAFPGTFGATTAGVSHSGGVIGASGGSRTVSSAVFANAMRYHGGGIAGLRPGEVPTILERGEEVLTTEDPRHAFNGGGKGKGGGGDVKVTNVNTFDASSFLQAALDTPAGEKVLLNFVSAKATKMQSALNR